MSTERSDLIPVSTVSADAATSPARWTTEWIRSLNSPRRWTADPSNETQPDVSPHGRWLAYVTDKEGSDDIVLLSLPPEEAAPPRQVVDSPARDDSPRFSPDGRYLAYVSTLNDAFGDIWISDVRGNGARRLTGRTTRDADPVWMPNGKSILFAAVEGEGDPKLTLVNVRSGALTPLPSTPADFPAGSQPDVSHDGRWVAFITASGQRLALYDTVAKKVLYPTPGDVPESRPRFTPDGRSILLARAADDTNADDRFNSEDRHTIWRLTLNPEGSAEALIPLTTARGDAREATPFPGGFFFASRGDSGNADVFSFALEGAVGPDGARAEDYRVRVKELAFLRPYEEELLLCAWRQVSGGRVADASPEARAAARLEQVRVLERLGRLGQAAHENDDLMQSLAPNDEIRGLAGIERERIQVSRTERASAQAGVLSEARQSALRELRTIADTGRDHPRVVAEARLLEAVLQGDAGDVNGALALTDDLLAPQGQLPSILAQALLLRGRMQERLGRPEDVAVTYRRVLTEFRQERREALEASRRIVDLATQATEDPGEKRRLLNELIADRGTPAILAAAARNRIGDLFVVDKRLVDALDTYRSTVQHFPGETEAVAAAHFAQSSLLYEQGKYGESVEVYERIESRLRPRNDAFYERARRGFIRQTLLKGEAEWRKRDPYLARATFASLLRYDPRIVEAWRGILRSDNALGRIPDTLAGIDQGLEKNPANPALGYARGLALSYLNNKEKEAMRALDRAALLDPSSPYPHQTLGYLFEQRMIRTGDRDAGERSLREYQLALGLTDPDLVPYNAAALLVNGGNAARLLGLWGLAQSYYSRRAQDPQPHEDLRTEYLFWRHAAESAFSAGDSAAAASFYGRAIAILPEARDRDTTKGPPPPGETAKGDSDAQARVTAKPAEGPSQTGVDWEEQQTDLTDRLALALQELGNYKQAAEGFRSVAERARDPRARALARRNVGVNLYLASRSERGSGRTDLLRQAWEALQESRDSVTKEGVIRPGERGRRGGGGLFGFAAIVGVGTDTSGAGFGFDRAGELRLLDGFLGWIAEADGDPVSALASLHAQIDALPRLTDSNKAYVLTQKAVLWSRVANLEERQGNLRGAARATLESLAACRWDLGKTESINTNGAVLAAMNLARVWALEPSDLPVEARKNWLASAAGEGEDPPGLEDSTDAIVARMLSRARTLLQATPSPPAAVLLPDVVFHQGLVALRRAEASQGEAPDLKDPFSVLRQAAEVVHQAQKAHSYFAQVGSMVSNPDAGSLRGTTPSPEDRERWRRLQAASLLQKARALSLLGQSRESEEAADLGLETARAWRFDDLVFAYYFETGLLERDDKTKEVLWRKAIEAAEATLPGQRSASALARTARATLAADRTRRSAESSQWEEAWQWSEWAIAQDLAADMDHLDPDLGDPKAARLASDLQELRHRVNDVLREGRRSGAPIGPAAPGEFSREIESLQKRWGDLLETARAEAPEVWALYSGRPLALADVIDFLGKDTAAVRLLWLETSAAVLVAGPQGLATYSLADPDGVLRAYLSKAAAGSLEPADTEFLSRSLFSSVLPVLEGVPALQIEADPAFLALPIETMPIDGRAPAFERWRITWVTSNAHRYLAETRRVPWRQRLLTLGSPAGMKGGGEALPYAWRRQISGPATGAEALAAGREANLIRSAWDLALDSRSPGSSRLRPEGGGLAPGSSVGVNEIFSAGWSVACAGIEHRLFAPDGFPLERFSALNLFLTGLTWGGCPSVVLGPDPGGTAGKDGIDARVWGAFWRKMAEESPAQALQEALKEAAAAGATPPQLAGYRLWGHPGLSGEAAKTFATDEYQDRLGRAVDAHKRKDWSAAVQAFQESLLLLSLINPGDPQMAQIAQILAEDADQAGEYDVGVGAAERLLALREAAGAPPTDLAGAYRLRGLLLSKSGHHAEAATAMTQSVDLFRKADDALAVLNTTVELGVVFENGDRYEQALETFQKAQQLSAESEAYAEEAAQWRRIGRVLLLRLERWEDARAAFEHALRLYTDLNEPRGQAEALLDLGQVSERQADFDQALNDYGRAEALAGQLDDKALKARTALNQSNTSWLTGNYLNCLQRVEEALALSGDIKNPAIQLASHNTAGLLRWSLNDFDRARMEFDKALALSRSTSLKAEEASTLNNLGLVWRSRAEYPKALDTFGSALRIDQQTGSRWGQAYDHRNIGMTHLLAGELLPAREQLEEAVRVSAALGARTNYVKAVLSLADTKRQLGLLGEAKEGYQEALSESHTRGIREVEWRALQGLALVALLENDRAAALESLDKAIALVEDMRASIRVEELQDGFLADKQGLYEQMILLLLDTGKAGKAFEYSERARGRSFIDLLGNQRLNLNSVTDQRLLDRDREIRGQITRLEADLAGADTDEKRQTVAAALQQRRAELADLLVKIRTHNPALSAFVSVDPITVEELSTLLDRDVALVEYFLAEKETIIWVVRNGSVTVVRRPESRADLVDQVTTCRRRIQGIEDVADLSRALYGRLITPIEPLISNARILAIVPHNALHYLSFASLSDGGGDLMDHHALFYLPSASVYRYTASRRRPTASLRVLAIGNPDLRNPALDLPFAAKEAERLTWAFPDRVDVLTGDRATEGWVRQHIADYGIIHIASHGEFDSVNPLFSAVELARDPDDDGRLTVREVFGLTINADLVTLSACQSGLARVNNGDDLVGLNRAFVYAGTHALLSSLWRVDDVATAVLVKHFYRVYDQTDKAEALRRAQIEVRQYNPHPAYWAGLVLTGDWK